jgi:thiol:disulfide interchange protein
MEILDGKEKAIPLYLGLPLYYIWGIILFVIANLVYLMYLHPDILENEMMLREGGWMLYIGAIGAAIHLLMVSIWRAKEGASGVIETIGLIIIATPILFLTIVVGWIGWFIIAVYVLYELFFHIWEYWVEWLSMNTYQYNLGLLTIQFVILLLGSIIVHAQIYGFSPNSLKYKMENAKSSIENE